MMSADSKLPRVASQDNASAEATTAVIESCGCILVHRDSGRQDRALVIGRGSKDGWELPKGRREQTDASLQATALRELREESGLTNDAGDVVVQCKIGESSYDYVMSRRSKSKSKPDLGLAQKISKRVHYFLVTMRDDAQPQFSKALAAKDGTMRLLWVGLQDLAGVQFKRDDIRGLLRTALEHVQRERSKEVKADGGGGGSASSSSASSGSSASAAVSAGSTDSSTCTFGKLSASASGDMLGSGTVRAATTDSIGTSSRSGAGAGASAVGSPMSGLGGGSGVLGSPAASVTVAEDRALRIASLRASAAELAGSSGSAGAGAGAGGSPPKAAAPASVATASAASAAAAGPASAAASAAAVSADGER